MFRPLFTAVFLYTLQCLLLWTFTGNSMAAETAKPKGEEPRAPHHPHIQLTIEIKGPYERNNCCRMHFQPKPPIPEVKISRSFSCGNNPNWKIACRYLGSDADSDRYIIERVYPATGPARMTVQKNVTFQGEQQLLFEDDEHLITIECR